MDTKLFLSEHIDAVYEFEKSHLPSGMSELEIEMQSREKPWRRESLSHYSGLGWSFVAEKNGKILGYLLGQPILFFNNWTQTLWVEHLSFIVPEVGQELMDSTIRWAKSKHLQKVVMNSGSHNSSFVMETFAGFKESQYLHLSTTKIAED